MTLALIAVAGEAAAALLEPWPLKIFVVKDHRLAERGTDDELLAAGGFYAELHAIQFGEQEIAVQDHGPRRHRDTENNMNRSGPVILLVITAAIISACGLFGPSESATGLWEARGPTHIPPFVYLNLQQSGDIITGTACYVSGGVVLYTAAPVTGRYPNVTYVVTETSGCARPLCEGVLGDRWTGKIDKTGDIVPTDPDGLRFRRTSTQPAACERGSR